MTSRLPRLLAIGTILILLAAACASDPTDEERAAARAALLESTDGLDPDTGERITPSSTAPDGTELPAASAPTTTAAAPDQDCTGEDCGVDAPAASGDITAAINSAPTEDLRFLLSAAVQLSEAAATACADLAAWTTAMNTASDNIELAAEAATTGGGDWLGSPNAATVAAAVRDQLILQRGCSDGAATGDDAAVGAAVAAAGTASGANDTLTLALTGADPATGSEFWYHSDQVGHVIELQRLAFASPVQLAVVGSSTAKRAVDPEILTEELELSSMNAAVAGLFPTTVAPWMNDVEALAPQLGTVIIGVASWQDFLQCDDSRRGAIQASMEAQARAFAPIAAIDQSPPSRQMVGGASASYQSPLLDQYEFFGERGKQITAPGLDQERVDQQTDFYRPQMAAAVYCEQNSAATRDLVADLRRRGLRVLTVAMPLHPDMAALHPEGRTAHDPVLATYEEAARTDGGEWLDLTDLLAPTDFNDLTHANAGGRDLATAAIVEATR